MENITVVGLKEMNQKLGKIERHLDDISKSLAALVKITNRQFPNVRLVPSQDAYVAAEKEWDELNDPDEEDEEDE